MDRRTVAHVLLAVDLASEPITGSVSVDGARARRFNGWIELTAAIEAARGGAPERHRERHDPRQPRARKDWGPSLG